MLKIVENAHLNAQGDILRCQDLESIDLNFNTQTLSNIWAHI